MTKEQATNILLTAVQIAQSKGAFTLEEAGIIAQAVITLKPKEQPTQEVEPQKEEVTPKKK